MSAWADEAARQLAESAAVLNATAAAHAEVLARIAEVSIAALQAGNKLLLCGNGGSAADASHIATEFTARYKLERRALPAIALGADMAFVTAVSNDYAFERVFAREIEALGRRGDVLWAFSTSGKSRNVLRAIDAARDASMITVGFTGRSGGELPSAVDLCLRVPSDDTPRIQEAHIAAAHIICDLVERALAR
ncbi:MAG: D-sedoheptulose 7-phosphate isomerase [Chloroflexi bacterium]|nr:D-sedoheptulose 7-phosphate isomerase [Chloroflexota bacterium]